MDYLELAGLALGYGASFCAGIALGCVVHIDRHETGKLAIGVGCLFACGAIAFRFL